MKFFINKIFDDEKDSLVHIQFSKFSRGEFKNKAMVVCKVQSNDVYKISTGPEYANEFVKFLAEKLDDKTAKINGIIISTKDLTEELDFDNKKQFMGVKRYQIDREMTGKEIINLCNKFPNAFFGLNFSFNETELNVKQKAPKSAKPGQKREAEVKVDFCKIKTKDKELVKSLLFDVKDFEKVEVEHIFAIKEIVISDQLKKEAKNDYSKIKDEALRKGKIIRKLKIDGVEKINEKEFEAQIGF